MEQRIRILVTGGTIDGLDYTRESDAPKTRKTIVPKLLRQAHATVSLRIEVVAFKDGRFITNKDRFRLQKRGQTCREKYGVITHGTTTMAETARFLGRKIKNKTIVLVGARVLGTEKNSDALFNLGSAITAVQLLPKGVYVVMHGKIFYWSNVRKKPKKGEFERIH